MGENVREGQVKNFKKGADRSLQQMSAPTLFDRPDIISTTYTASPMNGSVVSEGDQLDAHATADGQFVLLAKGHVTVGRIEGDGAKVLLNALRQPGSSGVVSVKVVSVSAVSGFMTIMIARGADSDGT